MTRLKKKYPGFFIMGFGIAMIFSAIPVVVIEGLMMILIALSLVYGG